MALKTAKPILQQDLYNAFYDAYMEQYKSNSVTELSSMDAEINIAFQNQAKKFSKVLSEEMAQAIYDFVMEINIQATISGEIVSPSGPCSGTIPPSNFNII